MARIRPRARSAMVACGRRLVIEGEAAVELTQPRDCHGAAVRARRPRARRRAPRPTPRCGASAAKVDDLGADRQRRQQLRALQRLGLVRQCREPAVDAALPILRARRQGRDREAAQIAQASARAGGAPAMPADREAAGETTTAATAQPTKTASGEVVELRGVVAHRVRRREERQKG